MDSGFTKGPSYKFGDYLDDPPYTEREPAGLAGLLYQKPTQAPAEASRTNAVTDEVEVVTPNAPEEDPDCPDNRPIKVGDEVEYCLHPATTYDPEKLVYRPAKVVRVWNDGGGTGNCNLVVTVDGTNDVSGATTGSHWAPSSYYSKTPRPYTYRRKAQ